MNETFKIYIDRLKSGQNEKINFTTSYEFLNIQDPDLTFASPVHISGEGYLAEEDLILHLSIKTEVVIPCLMCNEPIALPLCVENFYHTEPVQEINDGFFNYSEVVREALIMEAPAFAECRQGKCPQREQLKKFSTKPDGEAFPFSNL